MEFRNRTAVVTGASSGIGRALSVALSRRGCHLALADIDEPGLVETARLADRKGLRISRHLIDVGDRQAVADFPAAVRDGHRGVDFLFNNAGVAIGGTFEQASEEDFEWLFEINFWGVVRMTRAFLPLLKEGEGGWIVNMSSLYGLIAPPEQTAYAASKFAVRGFSHALAHELAGTNVGISVVHPGGVATAIAERARAPANVDPAEIARRQEAFQKFLTMLPAKAADIILKGVKKERRRIMVGQDARAAALIERLLPASYWTVIERMLPK